MYSQKMRFIAVHQVLIVDVCTSLPDTNMRTELIMKALYRFGL